MSALELQKQGPSASYSPPRRDGANNDCEADDPTNGGYTDTVITEKAINVDFDTFFHEHKSTKTVLGFRKCLRACYEFIRIGIYHCFLVCCGIPNVLIWACVNGYMVYLITWVYQPWLRLTAMCWYSCAPLLFLPFNAIILPVIKAVARAICQLRIKATLDGPLTEGVAAAVRSTSQSHAA